MGNLGFVMGNPDPRAGGKNKENFHDAKIPAWGRIRLIDKPDAGIGLVDKSCTGQRGRVSF
jgi:hypothetical protein